VGGVAVDDQEHWPGRVVQQSLAEVDEHLGVQRAVVDGEPQRALRGDRGDHVDRMPGAGGAHYRGVADRRPGGAGVVVRADPGLIGEVDRRPRLLGLGPNGRVDLALPRLNRGRVLLVGPVQRPLRGQPELVQQPAHTHHRQPHVELAADQLADHLPRPQRERKLQLPRISPDDQRVQPAQLLPGQPRRPPGHRPRPQRVLPTFPVLGHPAVHGAPGHSQCGGDILRMCPGLDLLDRAQPQHLQRLVVQLPAVVIPHGRIQPEHTIKVS